MALEEAGEAARGAALYVTLEPCAHASARGPACADLVVQSGVVRAVIGCEDPDLRTAGASAERLRQAGIEVSHIGTQAARRSLEGYLTRCALGRPHVTLKLATSLDGCIALADGTSRWITGEAARAHGHAERAKADAILVGGATLRTDEPRLDVRLPGLAARSPERWVLTRGNAPEGWRRLGDPAELGGAMADAQYLLVEGGAGAGAAFLAGDLVDRLLLYRAPILIGAGKAALADIATASLDAAHGRWALSDRRRLGSDTLEVYERTR